MASNTALIAWSCPTTRFFKISSALTRRSRSAACTSPKGMPVFWDTTFIRCSTSTVSTFPVSLKSFSILSNAIVLSIKSIAESGRCFSLKYRLANRMALMEKSSEVFKPWNSSYEGIKLLRMLSVSSTEGSSMTTCSNFPVISLSVSIFLVKPSTDAVAIHSSPWLSEDLRRLIVP